MSTKPLITEYTDGSSKLWTVSQSTPGTGSFSTIRLGKDPSAPQTKVLMKIDTDEQFQGDYNDDSGALTFVRPNLPNVPYEVFLFKPGGTGRYLYGAWVKQEGGRTEAAGIWGSEE